MVYVRTEHIIRWFKKHPQDHRTDQQGLRIICPIEQLRGFPAAELSNRPSHTSKCLICHRHLGHVKEILEDQDSRGEWQWPTIG